MGGLSANQKLLSGASVRLLPRDNSGWLKNRKYFYEVFGRHEEAACNLPLLLEGLSSSIMRDPPVWVQHLHWVNLWVLKPRIWRAPLNVSKQLVWCVSHHHETQPREHLHVFGLINHSHNMQECLSHCVWIIIINMLLFHKGIQQTEKKSTLC